MITWIPNKLLKLILPVVLLLVAGFISLGQGAQEPSNSPQEIADDISCGKCGMFPARYPQWQTQVVFSDGFMVPFDGCKCMFGFLFKMGQHNKKHTSADVAAVWVREFKTGDWINAQQAYYVIGSSEMGPMGKELIPFSDAPSAESFQKEYGGDITRYDAISMETLKPLMGKMHMSGKMKMKGQMDM